MKPEVEEYLNVKIADIGQEISKLEDKISVLLSLVREDKTEEGSPSYTAIPAPTADWSAPLPDLKIYGTYEQLINSVFERYPGENFSVQGMWDRLVKDQATTSRKLNSLRAQIHKMSAEGKLDDIKTIATGVREFFPRTPY